MCAPLTSDCREVSWKRVSWLNTHRKPSWADSFSNHLLICGPNHVYLKGVPATISDFWGECFTFAVHFNFWNSSQMYHNGPVGHPEQMWTFWSTKKKKESVSDFSTRSTVVFHLSTTCGIIWQSKVKLRCFLWCLSFRIVKKNFIWPAWKSRFKSTCEALHGFNFGSTHEEDWLLVRNQRGRGCV